jgi:5-methylcytosine-specific restriction endonuclease McrA
VSGGAVTTKVTGMMIGPYKDALRLDPCAYCGGPAAVLDHITSINYGGGGTWDNFTAACSLCNGRKGKRSLLSWLAHDLFARADFEKAQALAACWGAVGRPE